MSTPIQLGDAYVSNIANNPAVQAAFPFLKTVAQQIKSTAGKCSGCNGGNAKAQDQVQRARNFILDMPAEQLGQLKAILGIQTRQFVAYRASAGRSTRVIR